LVSAARLCQSVQNALVSEGTAGSGTQIKDDKSPVTIADFGAQALVSHVLQGDFPDFLMVGEENADELRADDVLRQRMMTEISLVEPMLQESTALELIDRGAYEGGPVGRHWALDPIDGTKGFLRGDQYAIALALIEDGEVILGVLGCPNLPRPDGEKGSIFVAAKGQGVEMYSMDGQSLGPAKVQQISGLSEACFCESVEKGHSSHSHSSQIAVLLGITKEPYRIDSQCKYAAVARGDASIYLRLPTKKGYQEKIWDHAAGVAVIQEAGGMVTDVYGKALDFSKGRTLSENTGVIVSNGQFHEEVLVAVRKVLDL
jgi:3'(2'), 5'-bisphosphate nucleotidase